MDATANIDAQIAATPDWRGATVASVRALVTTTAPELTEEWKWSTGMWSKGGRLVLGYGIFAKHVKVNFLRGAELADPDGLFNAGLGAKGSRGIDVREGQDLDLDALARLVRAATDAA